MLNKGLRDEKKVKIDDASTLLSFLVLLFLNFAILKTQASLTIKLTDFDLTIENLKDLNEDDLIATRWISFGLETIHLLIFLVLLSQQKQFAFLDRALRFTITFNRKAKTFRLIYLIKSLPQRKTIMKEQFYSYIQNLQDQMVEAVDGQAKFREDLWDRSEGGGEERVIENGAVVEKGGVNICCSWEIARQHAKAI
jgi:hypothetical protein